MLSSPWTCTKTSAAVSLTGRFIQTSCWAFPAPCCTESSALVLKIEMEQIWAYSAASPSGFLLPGKCCLMLLGFWSLLEAAAALCSVQGPQLSRAPGRILISFSSLALFDGNLARSGRPAAGGFLCCLSGRLKSHFVESCWTTICRSNGESPFLLGREGPWVATMQFLLCWSLGHCIRHAVVWALWEMTPVRGSRLFNTLKACC